MLAEEAKADRTATESQQRSIAARTEKLRAMLEGSEARIRELREEWAKVNSSRFSADEYLRCPLYGHTCQDGEACARYDKGQYEALEKFTADRESRLQRINDEGAALKADILKLGGQLQDAEKEMADSKAGYARRCAERESLNGAVGGSWRRQPSSLWCRHQGRGHTDGGARPSTPYGSGSSSAGIRRPLRPKNPRGRSASRP